jgi:glycosyltransferase involved in cell wall biosynthesis
MRILLIMDPGIPVPPKLYGGHERLVYQFAEEYVKLGHQVTLLAGPGSDCSGTVITFGVNDLNRSGIKRYAEVAFVWRYLLNNHKNFDLIHNFGRLIYLLPVLSQSVKKIMTYGRPVSNRGIRVMNALPNKNLIFTACSNYCVSTGNIVGKWATVYNTIDFEQYQLKSSVSDDAPLIFLGRLDRIKGVHTAIDVARQTGNTLLIAGNLSHTADNYAYFKTEVEPHIDDDRIKYIGPLNDQEKNKYLGQAKALLFPIEWNEPFGIVMIEAMACGTPVIAFNKGSVPEVIDDGITGFRVNNASEMIGALNRLSSIDRKSCREQAEQRFNVNKIAKQYLDLF